MDRPPMATQCGSQQSHIEGKSWPAPQPGTLAHHPPSANSQRVSVFPLGSSREESSGKVQSQPSTTVCSPSSGGRKGRVCERRPSEAGRGTAGAPSPAGAHLPTPASGPPWAGPADCASAGNTAPAGSGRSCSGGGRPRKGFLQEGKRGKCCCQEERLGWGFPRLWEPFVSSLTCQRLLLGPIPHGVHQRPHPLVCLGAELQEAGVAERQPAQTKRGVRASAPPPSFCREAPLPTAPLLIGMGSAASRSLAFHACPQKIWRREEWRARGAG